uniref:YEATS domain-containing protein 4 n=1 Tax=Trichuris muris TaxID=70415 RepID=A0A5S6Q0U8_TRIMR
MMDYSMSRGKEPSTVRKVKDGRIQDLKVVKPIVYGSRSHALPQGTMVSDHTHAWKLYVKPYYDEDISLYVRKVTFKLHDSYAQPTRVITNPPYEINETGWGEFEAVIRLFFADSAERSVNIYHVIRLFNNEPDVIAGRKPLIAECYDELIFWQPSVSMYDALRKSDETAKGIGVHAVNYEEKQKEYLEKIRAARATVKAEIDSMKKSLVQIRDATDNARKASKQMVVIKNETL